MVVAGARVWQGLALLCCVLFLSAVAQYYQPGLGFTSLLGKLADAVANQPQRPRWNTDSFFRRFAPQERPSAP